MDLDIIVLYVNNDLFVIPIPTITHRKNLGISHRDKLNAIINDLYCIDINDLLNK